MSKVFCLRCPGSQSQRWIPSRVRQPQQLSNKVVFFRSIWARWEERFQFVQLNGRFVVALESRRPFDLACNWIKRTVTMMRRTKVTQPRIRFAFNALQKCGHDSRLPDSRFARNHRHLTGPSLRSLPAAEQELNFLVPTHDRREGRRVKRFKPTFEPTLANHSVGVNRCVKPLAWIAQSSYWNNPPSSRRVAGSITTVLGAAQLCSRAARLSVAPTADSS